jgi:hypothetical protein
MPVDRASRDAAADILAAFLRGEIGRDALRASLRRLIPPEHHATVIGPHRDTYLDRLLEDGSLPVGKGVPISEEEWAVLCRHQAFLASDLEERSWDEPPREDDDTPFLARSARRHALGLLAALGLAYVAGWWLFAAAAVVSFVLFQVSIRRREAVAEGERRERLERRMEYYPFADRGEWLVHRHLLDRYRLPGYDASAFGVAAPMKSQSSVLAVPVRVASYLAVAAVIGYACAFLVVVWPLWLVLMSLCPWGGGSREKTTA